MHDLEFQDTRSGEQSHRRPPRHRIILMWLWEGQRLFIINYGIIAVLNTAQFILTLYGLHKLSTDPDNVDYKVSNWDALKFCDAVAWLTWGFLLYGVIRRTHDGWFDFFWTKKGWDIFGANFIIWALQLCAAAAQTAFRLDHFHCDVTCDSLNSGSLERNTAYAVLAWLLCFAWFPQLIGSFYSARTNY